MKEACNSQGCTSSAHKNLPFLPQAQHIKEYFLWLPLTIAFFHLLIKRGRRSETLAKKYKAAFSDLICVHAEQRVFPPFVNPPWPQSKIIVKDTLSKLCRMKIDK